ncbi:MAG: FAD-dependent oxidoreductase [Archangiaceae bacterium]|nr:FAD-dependent oxidoreductase [Archangiaceae bacterium]
MNDTTDVVIVGGGLAGLTCALGLKGSGLKVTVLERDAALGGRAGSRLDPDTHDAIDLGPHIFVTQYPNMMALLEQLGTADRVVWQPGRRFLTMAHGAREVGMVNADLPPPMGFVPSTFFDPTSTYLDKASNVPFTLYAMQLDEDALLELDDVPAADLLRDMGVTQRYVDTFWSFASMSVMNVPVEKCSAAALVRFYRRLIGHRSFQAGFADGGLAELFEHQARAAIEREGGQVLTRTAVRRLLGDARRATGVELEDGRVIEAKQVVAALPPQALSKLLPEAWVQAHAPFQQLHRFEACPYISTYLWFGRKLTERQFWARAHHPEDLNCDFYDLSNIRRARAGKPSLICSNIIYAQRAAHLSDDEVIAATRAELAEFIPAAADAKVVHAVVNRIPMAIHCPYPGTERARPEQATAIFGLTLAGDWMKTGLPSSMEGACHSGWRAAELLWKSVGQQRELVRPARPVEGFTGLLTHVSKWLPTRDFTKTVVQAFVRA